ncbi:hypothetical protein PI87_26630 [Ralstonia sp. A12]|uniref:hypothetical protein n=1 Tax=Ralstonia sp. A12 TaxID=1217052 RepID=UPI0005747E9F|nr:hypothetical protein [Ralstonia sp. A12]KHK49174.1 hypothetical protein PI87_26630 [Ralstonia sp. A12]
MRTLLFLAGYLVASPSIAYVGYTCTYNGEAYLVSMTCEEAIKRGIIPPPKEPRPDAPECAALKQQRADTLAQLNTAISLHGNAPDDEIAGLAKTFEALGLKQSQFGCKDAPAVP